VARFDTSHVEALQDDNAAKLDLAKNLANSQIGLSFDEAAALVGLRDVETEFGDVAWLPPNITSAEEALAHAEEQTENGRQGPDAMGSPPPQSSVGEEDDFPGSDDFESGSNGPTGSDGKQAAPRQRHDDATRHRGQGQPSNNDRLRSYYKGYESGVLAPGERKVQKLVKDYLGSYQRAQLKRLEAFAENPDPGLKANTKANEITAQQLAADEALLSAMLLDYAEWVEKLAEKIRVPLKDVLEASADDIALEIGGPSFNGEDPWAKEFLRSQRIKLAEGVNSTLAKKVKQVLVDVFEQRPYDMISMQEHVRAALPELRDSLRKAFASRSARAATIAHTEVNRAASSARFESMRREGVTEHQWVTSGDEQVRDRAPHSHKELDGAIRPVGESFREGRLLRYPLDPEGAPQDVINCRCVVRPIVED
jgi:SPP1 gp7 family putative phage head morphogenesis protein